MGTVGNGIGTPIQTLTLYWDGTSWTQVPSPSPGGAFNSVLTGVTATSGSDVWAVGDYISSQDPSVTLLTLILHWDGTAWAPAPSLQKGGAPITLTGVAAISSTEAWAVGIFGPTPDQTLAFHLK